MVVAAQPATQAVREEVTGVLTHVYQAAASAAALVPTGGLVNHCDRLANLERLFAELTGTNGTIDHLFNAMNVLTGQFNEMREELDCRASPGKTGSPTDSDVALTTGPFPYCRQRCACGR